MLLSSFSATSIAKRDEAMRRGRTRARVKEEEEEEEEREQKTGQGKGQRCPRV